MILAFCFIPFISSFADEINYIYDDANRLIRVEYPDGTTTEYTYDAVGNLLTIAQGTISNQGLAPVLQSITPDIVLIGADQNVTITGLNLLTTSSLTSDNQHITFSNVVAQDTSIQATFSIARAALPGQITFTVVTAYGSASIQATITSATLSFSPDRLSLIGGNRGTVTASLSPSVGKDVTIALKNSNPLIVSVPQAVVIPSSGTATLQVNPLIAGTSAITSGDARVDVFVIGGEITAISLPVSVYLDGQSGGASTQQSLPVSVYLNAQSDGASTQQSLPVSVYLDAQSGGASTIQSLPVSVQITSP